MNKRVMIVEDNSSTRQLLAELVKEVEPEAEIREFATMEGVYETAMCTRFDLFLLDIIMNPKDSGDTSGMQFANKIRSVSQYEFVPIIFVTSLEDPKLYAYSRLHSFGYIEKPFEPENVKKTIHEALRYSVHSPKDATLFLRKEGILYSIKCSDVIYIECYLRKMHFHLKSEEVISVGYKTIHQIMEEADSENFVQCGRNMIINKEHIDRVDLINKQIYMKNVEKPLAVGITYWKKVLKEIQND